MNLPMQLRNADPATRTLEGVCVPYDEISYLTPDPMGERVVRGAFTKSAQQRLGKVFLYREHDHDHPVGKATAFDDTDTGLHGTFTIRASALGDETLADVIDGYLPAMSVGYRPIQTRRAKDGAAEVVEAMLVEVSLVSMPAYDGARVLALRTAWNAQRAPFLVPEPSPVVPGWAYPLR